MVKMESLKTEQTRKQWREKGRRCWMYISLYLFSWFEHCFCKIVLGSMNLFLCLFYKLREYRVFIKCTLHNTDLGIRSLKPWLLNSKEDVYTCMLLYCIHPLPGRHFATSLGRSGSPCLRCTVSCCIVVLDGSIVKPDWTCGKISLDITYKSATYSMRIQSQSGKFYL